MGKYADADSKKIFTNKELEKLVDFIVLKYQNNPDDKNFSGALIEYIKNLVDGKSSEINKARWKIGDHFLETKKRNRL